MTMHMLPSYYTTTNTKKRKKKNKSKSLIAAEKEHEKFLQRMGIGSRSSVGSEQPPSKRQVVGSSPTEIANFKDVGVGTQGELIPLSAADYRSREGSIPSASTNSRSVAQSGSASGLGPEGRGFESSRSDQFYDPSMAKREPQVYNGKRKLLGIATMHKSNMVPVFSKDDAEDIAKMRRN